MRQADRPPVLPAPARPACLALQGSRRSPLGGRQGPGCTRARPTRSSPSREGRPAGFHA